MPLSLLTLTRNRTALLADLLAALDAAPDPPAEVVVGVCGGDNPAPHLPSVGFPTRLLDVGSDGDRIPYSAARNACARAARARNLLFLDADCVPEPGALRAFDLALEATGGLCIGGLRYLPPGEHDLKDVVGLVEASRPHPARPVPPAAGWTPSDAYELVWGLGIGIPKAAFVALGGFDTGYGGYAGEDTDLAVAARQAGVPLHVVAGATVFHRHHDVFEPPLQQLRATVANAQRFRDKWGWWPMSGWLQAFADGGWIRWTPGAETADVVRDPTPDEIEAVRETVAYAFRDEAP